MKKYFYSDGTQKDGPFTSEELKNLKISKDALVWYEGLDNWIPITQVEELNSMFHPNTSSSSDNRSTVTIPKKRRHGFVTAWLIWGIIVNSFFSFFYLFNSDDALMNLDILRPTASHKASILYLGILGLVNIFLYVQLFRWKKIGFKGFIVTSVIALMINLFLGYDIIWSLFGVIGMVILYYILQLKKKGVSAWQQLESDKLAKDSEQLLP